MLFKISRYKEIVTPESAENSDFDSDHEDHGPVYEDREMTFRELVRELREFGELSCWPFTKENARYTWALTHPYINSYRDGSEATESLHCQMDTDREARYWALALKFAGLAK